MYHSVLDNKQLVRLFYLFIYLFKDDDTDPVVGGRCSKMCFLLKGVCSDEMTARRSVSSPGCSFQVVSDDLKCSSVAIKH